MVNECDDLWKGAVLVSGSFAARVESWKRLCPEWEGSAVIFLAHFLTLEVYKSKITYNCVCVCLRLGALHRALALLPVLAAAGRRPPPPSASQDGDSSQTETRHQHHFCPVGWVKAGTCSSAHKHAQAAQLSSVKSDHSVPLCCCFPVTLSDLFNKPEMLNMSLSDPPEQYNTTKSAWIADYCNEEEQAPQSSPPEPWMGSSVDPPSFTQSEC